MIQYGKLSVEDFQKGQLLLIDKPLNWTSFDVVAKIRYTIRKRFNLKKIKVGHAGTLDPLATGLLIICTGKFTKRIADLTLENKTYTGTIRLGATTPSYDLETAIENELPTEHIREEMVIKAASELSGAKMQIPPAFSAKKVDGKRAYISARKGKKVTLEARPVIISKFEVDATSLPDVKFEIECSKGTYIRSIARDLGQALECGAHLTELRRTKIGNYSVDKAVSPMDFQEAVQDNNEDV